MTDPQPPAVARPAGFWIRAIAALADFAVFWLVYLSLGVIARRIAGPVGEEATAVAGMVGLFTMIFAATYTTILYAATGQTIGKMLVSARVMTTSGDEVPVGAAFLRFIGYFLSCATLGLGFIMAGLRRDRRALHDLVAGTRVDRVRTREVVVVAPPPPPPPRAEAVATSDVE